MQEGGGEEGGEGGHFFWMGGWLEMGGGLREVRVRMRVRMRWWWNGIGRGGLWGNANARS